MTLEKFYSGDLIWEQNASIAYKQYWVDSAMQKKLVEQVGGDLMLAAMIYAKTEEGCLRWLETKVPALQNIKPKQCLFDPKLMIRLRETLMRME
jgi:hypothetical protein